MAFDPKKWTLKTNEVFAAAIAQAKALSNPELTPDHLMAALSRQDDTLVPAILMRRGKRPRASQRRSVVLLTLMPSRLRSSRAAKVLRPSSIFIMVLHRLDEGAPHWFSVIAG